MPESPSQGRAYALSRGVALAGELVGRGKYVFSAEDARQVAGEVGIPETSVWMLLSRLTEAGWLVRLRRGLYAGTGRLPGGVEVPPFVVATSLVQPSAIGLWSALAYHDLSDQAPVVVTAITPRKVVTPSMRGSDGDRGRHTWAVAGVECSYVTLREQRFELGLERVWLDERFSVPITDRERAVLDSFALPRHFGGVGEGLSALGQNASSLDAEKLVRYGAEWGSSAVAKRLGWSLEHAGVDMRLLRPLLPASTSSYSPLDPGRPMRGLRDRRWKLVVNLAS